MWFSILLAFVAIGGGPASAQQKVDAKSSPVSSPQTISFCDLAALSLGPTKEIRVRAIYRVGFEWSELYSLKCQGAPRVWVDFSDDWESHTRRAVRKELDKDEGTFGVILRGKLSGGGGYGHMGVYSVKFEVTSVESAKRLDKRSHHPGALDPETRSRVVEFEAKP